MVGFHWVIFFSFICTITSKFSALRVSGLEILEVNSPAHAVSLSLKFWNQGLEFTILYP